MSYNAQQLFSCLPPSFFIGLWIVLGYTMIIFNKLLLTSWGFGFPFFLTMWHLTFATIVTQILYYYYPSLLGSAREGKITRDIYLKKFLPTSLCFAMGLVLGNSAYKYLSLAYIQMLKSMTPIPLLLLSFTLGREKPSSAQLMIVMMISFGISLSTVGEQNFAIFGFVLQIAAICSDVCRMTLMDSLLLDLKLDTLSTLYFMAPLSAGAIGVGFLIFEAPTFPIAMMTPRFMFILLLNAAVAFSLNISVILLISKTSALVMSLAGLLKDIMLVASSSIVFEIPLAHSQLVGYGISLIGLNLYRQVKNDPEYLDSVRGRVETTCNALLCCLRMGSGGGGIELELVAKRNNREKTHDDADAADDYVGGDDEAFRRDKINGLQDESNLPLLHVKDAAPG